MSEYGGNAKIIDINLLTWPFVLGLHELGWQAVCLIHFGAPKGEVVDVWQ